MKTLFRFGLLSALALSSIVQASCSSSRKVVEPIDFDKIMSEEDAKLMKFNLEGYGLTNYSTFSVDPSEARNRVSLIRSDHFKLYGGNFWNYDAQNNYGISLDAYCWKDCSRSEDVDLCLTFIYRDNKALVAYVTFNEDSPDYKKVYKSFKDVLLAKELN